MFGRAPREDLFSVGRRAPDFTIAASSAMQLAIMIRSLGKTTTTKKTTRSGGPSRYGRVSNA